jgi:hypothetical protein
MERFELRAPQAPELFSRSGFAFAFSRPSNQTPKTAKPVSYQARCPARQPKKPIGPSIKIFWSALTFAFYSPIVVSKEKQNDSQRALRKAELKH